MVLLNAVVTVLRFLNRLRARVAANARKIFVRTLVRNRHALADPEYLEHKAAGQFFNVKRAGYVTNIPYWLNESKARRARLE